MNDFSAIKHLSKTDIIKNGSYFTPEKLTSLVLEKCKNYISDVTTILDLGAGYGAFLNAFKTSEKKLIGTEYDPKSVQLLKQNFPNVNIYKENSLENISRKKYEIQDAEKLLIVGNPPYNDVTSKYQKGKKGSFVCDEDVSSRDLGISFLKAYDKLKADYICVLHPLAYLIKKQNFKSLKAFKEHYRLIDATIFSSKKFETIERKNNDFPVVAALYERSGKGMTFEDVQRFEFEILDSDKKLIPGKIKTIDGIVKKYPTKENGTAIQFYTLRDMNALLRNAAFINGPKNNGINVDVHNLYQYAWLYYLKMNFAPKELEYIYGNFSPLYSEKTEEKEIKNLLVSYAFSNNKVVRQCFQKDALENEYGVLRNDFAKLSEILKTIYIS